MACNLFLLINLIIITVSSTEEPAPVEPGQRLIKLSVNEPAKWMSEQELGQLLKEHGPLGFLDLTLKGDDSAPTQNKALYTYPSGPLQSTVVRKLFPYLKKDRMESFVRKMSSFPSRFSRHFTGPGYADDWLIQEIASVLGNRQTKEGHSPMRRVYSPDLHAGVGIPRRKYTAPTIIVTLDGEDPLKKELIILGAHYDSINGPYHPILDDEGAAVTETKVAPGADDNATGCAVLLEVLRLLVQFGIKLKYTLEFHWYAAEEMGNLGSGQIAYDYFREKKLEVYAMLNLDVIGYRSDKHAKTIAYSNDGTNQELTTFLKMLSKEYVEYGMTERPCKAGCFSDHDAWNQSGYPAAFFTEAELTPFIHTEKDTIETVNFEQVNEFAKLAVAFVIELGELSEIPSIPDPEASLASSLSKSAWLWTAMWLLGGASAAGM
ncbi:putative leucine aminopeptidase [Orchesella cincta]|uniref:Putative leucine aminopeptidase n=1 Tax=Orchesella cincta TaxID=48709 RepID=A0A1D2M613_ORCCI|nr:putative leucine aminopeptidase [Orchesella cincta]